MQVLRPTRLLLAALVLVLVAALVPDSSAVPVSRADGSAGIAPDFTTLLRTWIAESRKGNATTEDFVTLAEEISDEELGGFFDAWLRAAEPPARTAANGLD